MNEKIYNDYLKLSGEITEKLDNTASYERWLIIQEYIDILIKENQQLEEKENQQKEFIEWLEKESKELIRDAGYHQRICLDILEKYKEIIGAKDE